MPKQIERMTKAKVLEQINLLRHNINEWTMMTQSELYSVYVQSNPPDENDFRNAPSREYMLKRLVMRQTYYITNVLGLE